MKRAECIGMLCPDLDVSEEVFPEPPPAEPEADETPTEVEESAA